MKFHVGDRWADHHGDTWLVYRGSAENAYAIDSGGVTVVFTYGRSLSGLVLTRLISSERWIPFAEMMPEAPTDGEMRTVLIRDPKRPPCDDRERTCFAYPDSDNGSVLRWFESHCDETIEDMIGHGYSEWKYLTPPEESC